MNGHQGSYIILLIVPMLFLFLIIIASLIKFKFVPFLTKRRYLKMEMMRSEVEEQECWQHRLEDLYMEYIPLIGIFYKMIKR